MPNKPVAQKIVASRFKVNPLAADKIVILVACASADEARKIAGALVDKKLAACVNILSLAVESIYRWKGRVESATESLLTIKTTCARFDAVRAEVRRLHSYEVPEIIALPIADGSDDYLRWIADSVEESHRSSP